jgi:hypothetical protein
LGFEGLTAKRLDSRKEKRECVEKGTSGRTVFYNEVLNDENGLGTQIKELR